MTFDKIPSIESFKMMSHQEVRDIVGLVKNLEDIEKWEAADFKIKHISDALQDFFTIEELNKSLYWYAFALSSPKDDFEYQENNNVQKQIATKITEYVREYLAPLVSVEDTQIYTSSFLTDIESFRDTISRNKILSTFFQEQLQLAVAAVQQEFPEYKVSKIPELDRAIGGSETQFPDIPEEKVGEILSSFAAKYRGIREDFEVKDTIR